MGGSYEFAKTASANLREKDDALNSAVGGFLAGNMLGGFECTSPPPSRPSPTLMTIV